MLLRAHGIPARFVQGLLPGRRGTATGVETILRAAPTPGSRSTSRATAGRCSTRPAAAAAQRHAACPAGPVRQRRRRDAARVERRPAACPIRGGAIRPTAERRRAGTTGGGGSGSGPFIVDRPAPRGRRGRARVPRLPARPARGIRARDGLARRRRPGPPVRLRAAADPDRVRVQRGARRGPPERPARLQTVARAKVEVAYGRGQLGEDRLRALRDAQRRLRVALLRFIVPPARAPRAAASQLTATGAGAGGPRASRSARGWPPRPRCGPRRRPSPARPPGPGADRGGRSGCGRGGPPGRRRARRR